MIVVKSVGVFAGGNGSARFLPISRVKEKQIASRVKALVGKEGFSCVVVVK